MQCGLELLSPGRQSRRRHPATIAQFAKLLLRLVRLPCLGEEESQLEAHHRKVRVQVQRALKAALGGLELRALGGRKPKVEKGFGVVSVAGQNLFPAGVRLVVLGLAHVGDSQVVAGGEIVGGLL